MILWPWTGGADLLAAFQPTMLQAEGLAAVLASGLIMLLLGRAVAGPRIAPEVALIAGWGIVSLVLTFWGVTTPASILGRASSRPGVRKGGRSSRDLQPAVSLR